MPILFSIGDVLPGMKLARAAMTGNIILLSSNRKLTVQDIKLLKERGIMTVYVADPLLDEYCEDQSGSITVATIVQKKMVESIEVVEESYKKHIALSMNDLYEVQQKIAECIECIKENSQVVAILNAGSFSNYKKQHAINSMYLALLTAFRMKDYIKEQRNSSAARKVINPTDMNPLGLGMILCDIGLDIEKIANIDKMTKKEVETVLDHPAESYRLLPSELNAYAKVIVKSHHECTNGMGYPDHLTTRGIPILARIARVVDAFDIATSVEIFGKKALSHGKALWQMMNGDFANYYDAVVMKAFSTVVQPFPIGAKIKLTNGRYGVVVRHNPDSPFKPVVVMAYDQNGFPLDKKLLTKVDLSKDKTVKIHSFGDEMYSHIYQKNDTKIKIDKSKVSCLFDLLFP